MTGGSRITVFKCCQLVFGNGGKKNCMKMSQVHIMNFVLNEFRAYTFS